jgi:hypothetical protein
MLENYFIKRYKVIAGYPNSPFSINEILELQESLIKPMQHFIMVADFDSYTAYYESDFNLYPHLFKKLEWWEDRLIDNMPNFVKCNKKIYKVLQKWEVSVICEKHYSDNLGLDVDWDSLLPSTEEEFLNSQPVSTK